MQGKAFFSLFFYYHFTPMASYPLRFLLCCPSPLFPPRTLLFPSCPACLPLERSRGWRGCAAGCTCCCARGESGALLPKHLCRSKFMSSGMLQSRELRATFGFKFVQKVGMSLFRLFFFLIELLIAKVKEHKT